MAKPKLTPRERRVLDNSNSKNEYFIGALDELSGTTLDLIDVLYLDAVIGQTDGDIDKNVEKFKESLRDVINELGLFEERK